MEHASWHKAGWLRAFVPESGVLHCVGTLDRTARRARTPGTGLSDLRAGAGSGVVRGGGRDARAIAPGPRAAAVCNVPPEGARLDGTALCHDLFGVCASEADAAPRVCGIGAVRLAMPRIGRECFFHRDRALASNKAHEQPEPPLEPYIH